eukprot:TRINITY_DN4603_c0_g1_i6.p1 TRINITY_DN4603_c0_g1~~TRINITY_DN4603_c0_g1_i6.p1  ORF type:complete len:1294 (-),score=240.40 TRINITY_DN4603_c0_g1_i6:1306-5187(-)
MPISRPALSESRGCFDVHNPRATLKALEASGNDISDYQLGEIAPYVVQWTTLGDEPIQARSLKCLLRFTESTRKPSSVQYFIGVLVKSGMVPKIKTILSSRRDLETKVSAIHMAALLASSPHVGTQFVDSGCLASLTSMAVANPDKPKIIIAVLYAITGLITSEHTMVVLASQNIPSFLATYTSQTRYSEIASTAMKHIVRKMQHLASSSDIAMQTAALTIIQSLYNEVVLSAGVVAFESLLTGLFSLMHKSTGDVQHNAFEQFRVLTAPIPARLTAVSCGLLTEVQQMMSIGFAKPRDAEVVLADITELVHELNAQSRISVWKMVCVALSRPKCDPQATLRMLKSMRHATRNVQFAQEISTHGLVPVLTTLLSSTESDVALNACDTLVHIANICPQSCANSALILALPALFGPNVAPKLQISACSLICALCGGSATDLDIDGSPLRHTAITEPLVQQLCDCGMVKQLVELLSVPRVLQVEVEQSVADALSALSQFRVVMELIAATDISSRIASLLKDLQREPNLDEAAPESLSLEATLQREKAEQDAIAREIIAQLSPRAPHNLKFPTEQLASHFAAPDDTVTAASDDLGSSPDLETDGSDLQSDTAWSSPIAPSATLQLPTDERYINALQRLAELREQCKREDFSPVQQRDLFEQLLQMPEVDIQLETLALLFRVLNTTKAPAHFTTFPVHGVLKLLDETDAVVQANAIKVLHRYGLQASPHQLLQCHHKLVALQSAESKPKALRWITEQAGVSQSNRDDLHLMGVVPILIAELENEDIQIVAAACEAIHVMLRSERSAKWFCKLDGLNKLIPHIALHWETLGPVALHSMVLAVRNTPHSHSLFNSIAACPVLLVVLEDADVRVKRWSLEVLSLCTDVLLGNTETEPRNAVKRIVDTLSVTSVQQSLERTMVIDSALKLLVDMSLSATAAQRLLLAHTGLAEALCNILRKSATQTEGVMACNALPSAKYQASLAAVILHVNSEPWLEGRISISEQLVQVMVKLLSHAEDAQTLFSVAGALSVWSCDENVLSLLCQQRNLEVLVRTATTPKVATVVALSAARTLMNCSLNSSCHAWLREAVAPLINTVTSHRDSALQLACACIIRNLMQSTEMCDALIHYHADTQQLQNGLTQLAQKLDLSAPDSPLCQTLFAVCINVARHGGTSWKRCVLAVLSWRTIERLLRGSSGQQVQILAGLLLVNLTSDTTAMRLVPPMSLLKTVIDALQDANETLRCSAAATLVNLLKWDAALVGVVRAHEGLARLVDMLRSADRQTQEVALAAIGHCTQGDLLA